MTVEGGASPQHCLLEDLPFITTTLNLPSARGCGSQGRPRGPGGDSTTPLSSASVPPSSQGGTSRASKAHASRSKQSTHRLCFLYFESRAMCCFYSYVCVHILRIKWLFFPLDARAFSFFVFASCSATTSNSRPSNCSRVPAEEPGARLMILKNSTGREHGPRPFFSTEHLFLFDDTSQKQASSWSALDFIWKDAWTRTQRKAV